MKDIKKERSEKVVKFPMVIAIFVIVLVIVVTYGTHNDYEWGSVEGGGFLFLISDVKTLYKSGDITGEQMKEYMDAVNNILDMSRNGEISSQALKNYNNVIKEISILKYEECSFSSTGKEFARGLKDRIISQMYKEIVRYYRELIPEEKYNSFEVMVDMYGYNEEDLTKIIDYGKRLVEEYVATSDKDFVIPEFDPFTGITVK